jgi:hypothetical protein
MLAAAILFAQVDTQRSLEARLHKVFAGVQGVRFGQDGETLLVKLRTVTVTAPKRTKSVSVMQEGEQEERPALSGFILKTYEFPHKPSEPARPMQAVRLNPNWVRDYGTWKMDAGERQVIGADKARYYYFEWGNKADRKMLADIKKAIEYGTKGLK